MILIRPISAQGRTKTQLLMYKTTVYTLVNGGITRYKQQISEKGDITRDAAWHCLSVNVLLTWL